jgi:hypothetical protein
VTINAPPGVLNNCATVASAASTPQTNMGCAQVTVTPPPQIATGGVSNTCSNSNSCSTASQAFTNPVKSGDVIVVALDTAVDLSTYMSNGWNARGWSGVHVTDSLKSSYNQVIGKCSSQFRYLLCHRFFGRHGHGYCEVRL